MSLRFSGQYCLVGSKAPLRKTLKKEPIMTDVRRYTDLRIAQSSHVHARLIERFIEVTEAELASRPTLSSAKAWKTCFTRCATTVAAMALWVV